MNNGYYYVGLVPTLNVVGGVYTFINNRIALYTTKQDALMSKNRTYAEFYNYYYQLGQDAAAQAIRSILPDPSVVDLKSYSNKTSRVKIYDKGTIPTYKVELTARVLFDYSSAPVRSILSKIKFDRITYRSKITNWLPVKEYFAEWKADKNYVLDQLVIYQGLLYKCTTVNNDSTFVTTHWQRVIKNVETDKLLRYTASMVLKNDVLYRCIKSNSDQEFVPENWERVFPSDPELTAADRIKAFYKPTSTMPGPEEVLLMEGVEYPGNTFRGEVFSLGWDGQPWDDRRGWDAILHDPDIDTILRSPPFPIENKYATNGTTGEFDVIDSSAYKIEVGWYVKGNGLVGYKRIMSVTETDNNTWLITIDGDDTSSFVVGNKYEITEQPSYYDVSGGTFPEGYGPEELLSGVITDRLNLEVNTYQTWEQVKQIAAPAALGNSNYGQFIKLISEDEFIISAPRAVVEGVERGSVFIYKRNGDDWEPSATLKPWGPALLDTAEEFGAVVASNKDYLVVGCGITINTTYIFRRSPDGWVQDQKLYLRSANIVMDDKSIYIGSREAAGLKGAVYVYQKQEDLWQVVQTLTASDGDIGHEFGAGLAIYDFTLVVGSPGNTGSESLQPRSGSAYVFEFNGVRWVEIQKLSHSNQTNGDIFGHGVSINASRIAVTAFGYDKPGVLNSGAVYIYEKKNTTWVETQILAPEASITNDVVGWSVSMTETVIAIGAIEANTQNSGVGSVYLYTHMGSRRDSDGALTSTYGWQLEHRLNASDAGSNKRFGNSISLIGNTLIVGSPGVLGGSFPGAAYVFSNFEHTVIVDRFGDQIIKNDSRLELPKRQAYMWWYGIGAERNTTLLANTSESATLLKE